MKQYLDLCRRVLEEGSIKPNRTGVDTIGIHGAMMQFDMADGFPVVTTKKLAWRTCFAEMLGFLRGYDSARQFRAIGCRVWDANANSNATWRENPWRTGKDDLGRIYGVQARRWYSGEGVESPIDQLKGVIDLILKGQDNRRLIVTHWNPGDLDMMALPPCHLLYQFGIEENRLNLTMYQRSADLPLGVPFNIAGYSWLLHVIAHITGHEPGVFTHFIHDAHIYINQIDLMLDQIEREPLQLPELHFSPEATDSLYSLENSALVSDFWLEDYSHYPPIKYPFSV